jgi:hypothetical protein
MDTNPLVALAYKAFRPTLTWVMFTHGTCIVFIGEKPNAEDLARQALQEHGEVRAGSSAGDFSVSSLEGEAGWLVFFDYEWMITLVLPEEVGEGAQEFNVGFLGRSKRQMDWEAPVVLHVQQAQEPTV